MESPAKALYELQEIDLSIIAHQQGLEAVAHALEDNEAVQAAQATVKQIQDRLKPLETQVRDLELQVQSNRQKREQTETRLYSGSVNNSKELQDMQHSIASLKKREGELEDNLLELMLELESTQAEFNQAQDILENVRQKAENDNLDLLSEKDKLQSELGQLSKTRQVTAQALSEEDLNLYESMKSQKANRPISALSDDEFCSVCGVQQRSVVVHAVRRDDDLVRCENCGRILVYL